VGCRDENAGGGALLLDNADQPSDKLHLDGGGPVDVACTRGMPSSRCNNLLRAGVSPSGADTTFLMAEPLAETIRRAQAGDQAAIASLVAEQQRYVYSIAMSITKNPTDAADLTQDALIRFIRAIGSYRGETKLSTWLYRLVVNLGIDRMRRQGAPPIRLDDEGSDIDVASDDPIDDVAGVAERAEEAQIVRAAVSRLPDAQRLALTLHYFEDLRYEDIAEVMGVPLNTVKSHIRRGKERLALVLAPTLGSHAAQEAR
jgi:RNA polymerase sigma-70 factor, ECF subfamily